MEPKYSKIFNGQIMQAVSAFCELNSIDDIDGFIKKCFKQGFDIEKFGFLGKPLNGGEKQLINEIIGEKQLIKEIIVEKRVEIPVEVEVIKEVEKIVEVIKYVDREVIKEIPVEKVVTKIEYICDKNSEDELVTKIKKLEEEKKLFSTMISESEVKLQNFSTITTERENNFQNEMSKKDKELEEVRRSLDIKLDDNKSKMLQETLYKLRKDISEKDLKIKELERLNQELQNTKQQLKGVLMNGSNLNNTL